MTRWEYMEIWTYRSGGYPEISRLYRVNGKEIPDEEEPDFYDYLNQLGDEGWELVAVSGSGSNVYSLKRPKP